MIVNVCIVNCYSTFNILFQPLHDYRTSGHAGRERRRIPGLSKAQRRIKASSTPALLDRNHDRYATIIYLNSIDINRSIGSLFHAIQLLKGLTTYIFIEMYELSRIESSQSKLRRQNNENITKLINILYHFYDI